VTALSDVAVSIYLPQFTGSATMRQDPRQTNYVATGDVSANASLTGRVIEAATTSSPVWTSKLPPRRVRL
jgi:hypothetical protein